MISFIPTPFYNSITTKSFKMLYNVAIILGIVALTYAAPKVGTDVPTMHGGVTERQGKMSCGSDTTLSCCNKSPESGDSADKDTDTDTEVIADNNTGADLAAAGISLLDGCTVLSPDSECSQALACCLYSNPPTVSIFFFILKSDHGAC